MLFSITTTKELDNVRYQFPNIESKEQADLFLQSLNNNKNNLAQAYCAAMFFMKSRYEKFPLTKLKYHKKGKKQLDFLITESPNNIEMRYIRFLIQSEIPKFLGYNSNLEEDFLLISQQLLNSNISPDLKSNMLKNMVLTTAITPQKKEIIKNIQQQL